MSAELKHIPVLEPIKRRVIRTATQMNYDHTSYTDMERWIDNNIGKLREHFQELQEELGEEEITDFPEFCAVQYDLCEQQAAWVLAGNRGMRGAQ